MLNNSSKFYMYLKDIRCIELINTDKKHSFLVIHEKIDEKMNTSIINCSNIKHVLLFDDKIENDEYERILN